MPNLLDCPQEIQDMIYEAYFKFTLDDYPLARIHRYAPICTSRRVAADAIQVSDGAA